MPAGSRFSATNESAEHGRGGDERVVGKKLRPADRLRAARIRHAVGNQSFFANGRIMDYQPPSTVPRQLPGSCT